MNAHLATKIDFPRAVLANQWEARRTAMSKLPVSEEINDSAYRSAVMPCHPFEERPCAKITIDATQEMTANQDIADIAAMSGASPA